MFDEFEFCRKELQFYNNNSLSKSLPFDSHPLWSLSDRCPSAILKHEDFLPGTLQILFSAGSETVRTAIGWAYYTMAAYPKVQIKIQKEIDIVFGTECTPSVEHMKDLPYSQAVLFEILRWRTVAPIIPLRMLLDDIDVYGYHLPKGTLLMGNLWAAQHDPECWGNPDKFIPERFLSDDGELRKSENLIPFSYGKRACPGEGLAITETFLYLTTILQKFTLSLPPGVLPDFEGELSITYHPKPYELCLTHRKSVPMTN